ncbi:hypothetical protein Ciccas_000817 [Cichlidogyrus casuarinus]|uniref:Uncharacterized protein n=1 Tax=Cichlidogyrus casuarinus TaxID=1844966 RepID=A0ABD2QM61_9PLAT
MIDVPTDGRNLAEVYTCDFYEISVTLNHHVNELLVGLITAMEAGQERVEKERDRLAVRMASISMGSGENSGARRGSIINQINAIKNSHGGTAVSKFFKKHFASSSQL